MSSKRTQKAQEPQPGSTILLDPTAIVIPGIDNVLPENFKGASFDWTREVDENGVVKNLEQFPLYDTRVEDIVAGEAGSMTTIARRTQDFSPGGVGQISNISVLYHNGVFYAMAGNHRVMGARGVEGGFKLRSTVYVIGGDGGYSINTRGDVLRHKYTENNENLDLTARQKCRTAQQAIEEWGDAEKAASAFNVERRTLTNWLAYASLDATVVKAFEDVTKVSISGSHCIDIRAVQNKAKKNLEGDALQKFMVEAATEMAKASLEHGSYAETRARMKAQAEAKANENLTEAEAEAKAKAEAEAKAKAERRKATAQVLRNLDARLQGDEGEEYRKEMGKAALAALDQLRAAQAVLSGEAEMPEALASAWAKIQADEAKAKADAEKAEAKGVTPKAVTPKADNGEALINMAKAFAANGVSRDALEGALAAANAKGREAALKAYDEAVKG